MQLYAAQCTVCDIWGIANTVRSTAGSGKSADVEPCPFPLSLLLFCSFFFSPFASWRSRTQVQLGVCGSTVTVSPSAGPGKPGRQTVSRVHSGLKMTLYVIALLHKLSDNHAIHCDSFTGPCDIRIWCFSEEKWWNGFQPTKEVLVRYVPYRPTSSPGQTWCWLLCCSVRCCGTLGIFDVCTAATKVSGLTTVQTIWSCHQAWADGLHGA